MSHASPFIAQLERYANFIMLLVGWRRHCLAFLAGIIAALALAPLDFLPAFVIAFPVLVLLMDGTEVGEKPGLAGTMISTALVGWWFGFGYFLAGLWWLGAAFIAGGAKFIWLMPLGVIILPAALALFMAFGLMVARLFWSFGALRIFALAFGLGISEWLRGFLFSGFPWNGFGQAFANHITLVQFASLIGAEGLGVVAVVLFSSPALLIAKRDKASRVGMVGICTLIFAGMFLFGTLRLESVGGSRIDFSTLSVVPEVQLRIVQPNRRQETKKEMADGGMAVLNHLLTLSDRATGPKAMGVSDVTHLIWPEAPLPFTLENNPTALEKIKAFLPAQTRLITGGIRLEVVPDEPMRTRYFNTMQVLDSSGILGQYDKVHLVPFGEYLPFDLLLRAIGLEEFVHVIGGFSPGASRSTLHVAGLPPVVPLICFESIFSFEVGKLGAGGKMFLNITNDAWFGETPGPYQHLAQARLRAVEFGLPLIRAANSGISIVYDPFGRIVAHRELGKTDILDSPLPTGLTNTLYRRATWYSFVAVMVCCLIFAWAGRLRR